MMLTKDQSDNCYTCFHKMRSSLWMWNKPEFKQRNLWRIFYTDISTITSGIISLKASAKNYAYENDRLVDEHWSTPEKIGKFIFDNASEYLEDYDKFKQLYMTCSMTIKTLKSENITLSKQKGVRVLEKYKNANINLIHPKLGVLMLDDGDEFPFTLPEKFLQQEGKYD